MTAKKNICVANEIYKDVNYDANINFIKSQVGQRKSILDTNSENGKFLGLLEKEGFEISALVSSRKSKKFLEENTECKVFNKSLFRLRKPKDKYDVVISLFSACNKFKNYIGIDNALGKMAKCLKEDGIIILELARKVKQSDNNKLLQTSKVKTKKEKVKVVNVYKVNNKNYKFKSKLKIFEIEKIANIAKKNRLKIVDVYRDYSVKVPDEYGDNMQIVLAFNNDETKREKKTRKKQFVTKKGKVKVFHRNVYIFTMILMIFLGGVCGSFVGDYYNSNFANRANFNYTDAQIAEAMSGIEEFDRNLSPDELGVVQSFMLAEYLMKETNFAMTETGVVNTMVSGMAVVQNVAGSLQNKDGTRTRVTASTGMVPVGVKTVYQEGADNLLFSKGTPSDLASEDFGITWNEEKNQSLTDYHELWGVTPSWFMPYVVCDATVAKNSSFEKSGSVYTATLTLKTRSNSQSGDTNNLMAYTYYVKQIAQMSGVTVTDFNFCTITFSIDENYRLLSISVEEEYSVIYGIIPVVCSGNLTQTFTY